MSAAGVELAKVFTDPRGDFWIDQLSDATKVLPAGALVGVRNATSTKSMVTPLGVNDGSCNVGCHIVGAGKIGRVSL